LASRKLTNEEILVAREDFDLRGHDVFGPYPRDSYIVYKSNHDFLPYSLLETFICERCGDSVYFTYQEQAGELKASAKRPCAVEEILPFEVTLAVPSGELLFGDTLFSAAFEAPPRDYATMSLNNALGRENFSKFYETFGVVTGRVNLRSPDLWYNHETGELLVAAGVMDEDSEDEDFTLPPKDGFVLLGSLSGDVWGYEIADREDFLSRGGVIRENSSVAPIKPGTYRFVIAGDLDALDDIDYDEPVIYASGELEG
jgi:hypothetical protein